MTDIYGHKQVSLKEKEREEGLKEKEREEGGGGELWGGRESVYSI